MTAPFFTTKKEQTMCTTEAKKALAQIRQQHPVKKRSCIKCGSHLSLDKFRTHPETPNPVCIYCGG